MRPGSSQSAPKLTKQPVSLGADFLGDDDLVQPVLRGQNGAVLGEMRLQGTHRVTGMMGLDGEDDALELACAPLPAAQPSPAGGRSRRALR